MKKQLTTIILSALIGSGLYSCNRNEAEQTSSKNQMKEIASKNIDTVIYTTERVRALDSSVVFVRNSSDGGFEFYRDKNNDGWAETKGKGFYFLGLSKISSEYDLEPKTVSMKKLE